MTDRTFDRLERFDERSREYPMSAVAPLTAQTVVWPCPTWLDQGSEGACFPAGTLVRMADGSHRAIEDVHNLDEVVTAEGNTGVVVQTMVRRASKLVEVKLRGHCGVLCTPEHPVLTKRGYVPANELTAEDRVALTRWLPNGVDRVAVPVDVRECRGVVSGMVNAGGVLSEVTPVPAALNRTGSSGRLVGLYAAEGSTTANKVVWSFGGHERDTLVEETVALIKECLGANARVQVRPCGSVNVVVYGKLWRRFFEALVPGTARHGTKRLSAFVAGGPTEFLRGVLFGWLAGDGHARRGSVDGVSVCKYLSLDMHAIANGLGLWPVLSRTKPSMNKHAATRQMRYDTTLPAGTGPNLQLMDDKAVWRRVVSVEPFDWAGWVYNLHVCGDESYVADGIGVHNCVGHAISHALACPPEPRTVDSLFARNLYFEAQKIDQFPGGEYAGADPRMSGTSVLAGFRVARREKYVGAYRWAFGPAELCNGLSTGPAVLGVRWHAGMSNPGRDGLVRPLGSVVGGHALCCRGYDAQRKMFILRNSWGRGWGADGDCLVTFDDMASLLADGGEACFPLKGAAANKTLVHKLAALFGCR